MIERSPPPRPTSESTSSGFSALSSCGLSEPVAHRIESEMFDLPEPFGPTTTATPGSRRISTGSTNDLKPRRVIAFRCTPNERLASLPDGPAGVSDKVLEPPDQELDA